MKRLAVMLGMALLAAGCGNQPVEVEDDHVHFLHQSTGANFMDDHPGTDQHPDPDYGLNTLLENAGFKFTDDWMDDSYPTSIAKLFADDGRKLSRDAKSAEILMFKSCYYPIDGLTSDAALEEWKQAFLADIVPYAKAHSDQTIIAMPTVPYREQDASADQHDRARAWADWLAGGFLDSCPSNVVNFDLFDIWADSVNNWLRKEFEGEDSHPNDYASLVIADSLAAFICRLAGKSN